jgi:integrase
MSVRKKKWRDHDGRPREKWMIHIKQKGPDGRCQVIRRVSPINTRRAAEQYERELREQLLSSPRGEEKQKPAEPAPKEVPLFGDFAEEFMAYQATLNKPTELKSKRSILQHHLIPAFGHLPLDQIDARLVDRYKIGKLSPPKDKAKGVSSTRRQPEAGLRPKSINNHLMILSRALRIAHKWKLLDRIPEIEMLRVPKQPFDFLGFEEADRFLAAARKHEPRWYPYAVVSIRTGLRVGEMLALRWGDHVRFAQRQLRVELSYTRAGGMGSTKSDKAREVPLTWDALEALEEQRKWSVGPLVFPSGDGEVHSLRSVGHFVGKIARHAKLRHVHPHMLRHTFASHAMMRGVPIRVLQEWLGHASIEMTMRYAHLSPSVSHELIDLLAPDKPVPSPRSTMGAHDRGPIAETAPKPL